MKLGEYIKNYRNAHDNMSYHQFADLVGLSVQYVSNLEKGINNDGKPISPTMTTFGKIADGTGITLSALLHMIDDSCNVNPSLTDEEVWIIDNYRKADKETQDKVKAIFNNKN